MDSYVNLRILDDPEISLHHYWSVLYQGLHQALAKEPSLQIAVSFPDYAAKANRLGATLRLHGEQSRLQALLASDWIAKGLLQALAIGQVEPVPQQTKHCTFRRVQVKSGVERLVRRYQKRHGVTLEQARAAYASFSPKRTKLPYIRLRSASNGHNFVLNIEQSTPSDVAAAGRFNTYGLSDGATVPWF